MLITLIDVEKTERVINPAQITQLIKASKTDTSVCLIDTGFVMRGSLEEIKNKINQLWADEGAKYGKANAGNKKRTGSEASNSAAVDLG